MKQQRQRGSAWLLREASVTLLIFTGVLIPAAGAECSSATTCLGCAAAAGEQGGGVSGRRSRGFGGPCLRHRRVLPARPDTDAFPSASIVTRAVKCQCSWCSGTVTPENAALCSDPDLAAAAVACSVPFVTQAWQCEDAGTDSNEGDILIVMVVVFLVACPLFWFGICTVCPRLRCKKLRSSDQSTAVAPAPVHEELDAVQSVT